MKGRTHLAFAACIASVSVFFLESSSEGKAVFALLIILASFLPDIDHPDSMLGKSIRPISSILGAVAGHRGIFHSIVVPLILFLLLYLAGYLAFGIAVMIGYFSHLILDSLNHSGVRWLYPLPFRFRGVLRSGGLADFLFFLVFVKLTVIMWIILIIR